MLVNLMNTGSNEESEPDAAARALAVASAAAVTADLVGVDLLPLPDGGSVAVELNGAVDFDWRDARPGRDVYRDTAAALGLAARGGVAAA